MKFYRGSDAEVSVPDGVVVIDRGAFDKNLSADWDGSSPVIIHLPFSVRKAEESAFRFCRDLKMITAAQDSEALRSADGILYDRKQLELIQYPGGRGEERFTIPESVIRIADGAFCDAVDLKKIMFHGPGQSQSRYVIKVGNPEWDGSFENPH